MNLAYEYGADRIWIVNVGDLKPMEFPIEFFLTFAWDPHRWPKETIAEYTRMWAEREFGPEHATEIAHIVSQYTKLNGRRKPELLEPDTFSQVNYQEADRVLAEWQSLVDEAETIYASLPPNMRDAFYELVLVSHQGVGTGDRDLHHRGKESAIRARRAAPAPTILLPKFARCFRPTPICPPNTTTSSPAANGTT